jgi:outer membrane protein assembly factor BamB
MPIPPRRPRPGRLLDWLAITLFLAVFAGLGVYHYQRLDQGNVDPGRQRELSERKLSDAKNATHDWPQWRGPNRDGVSTERGLLTVWPKDGPRRLWEAKTGDGFASVVVARGRAFTIFQDGDSEAVVCWDAETGREIWRHRYECAYTNQYGNGPRSTPSIDGDRIYTVGATGIMHCLDAATDQPRGRVVWRKDLLDNFDAPTNDWGVAFSPLVEGDRVFVMPGGPNGRSLAALDRNTGTVLWQKHDDRASYSSPVSATFHGQPQILFLTGSRLVSVAPDSGDLLWSYPWPVQQQCNIATPIVVDDYVFISTGYNKGCAVLKIEKHEGLLRPSAVYENRRMRNHFSSSVRHKDHLYGFDDTNLVCMDFRTGEVTWKQRDFDKGSVLLVGDQLIVYGANGLLALADANPEEYVERSRFEFSKQGRQCWSAPVVANGRLYVRDQERLVCFDVKASR